MEAATHYKHDGSKPVGTSTYIQGVAQLRGAGQERPFTFRENILARVEAYERGDKTLFNTWLNSCTGIVTKKGTTKLKIDPRSANMIAIPEDFTGNFLPVIYDDVPVRELDSSNGNYNRLLGKNEIEDHQGWREALENDVALLRVYRDIIFNDFKKGRAMRFNVQQNAQQDELRALFVRSLDYSSSVGGYVLNGVGSFLRGSTKSKSIIQKIRG